MSNIVLSNIKYFYYELDQHNLGYLIQSNKKGEILVSFTIIDRITLSELWITFDY